MNIFVVKMLKLSKAMLKDLGGNEKELDWFPLSSQEKVRAKSRWQFWK